jgi:DNA-binding response OmpR family regulator
MKNRILIVEDESLIAMFISEMLETAGFEVVGPCQTVAQALAQLAIPDCCDAAVLDASLRNESAVPVAKALVALGVPFVVATGYNLSQLPAELAAAPILTKPVNSEVLIADLRRFLSTG